MDAWFGGLLSCSSPSNEASSGMLSLLSRLTKLMPRSVPPIILVGIAGSSVAVFFHHAIHFVHHTIWSRLAAGPIENFATIGFIVLSLAGLLNGWLLTQFATEAAGSGIPQLKTAYRQNYGVISFRVVWVKLVAATLSVGGGLSLGREGPSVQLAGGLASVIGQKFKLSAFRIRTLTACGSAAGLAAAFNAPIAAVAFVLEEIIEDLNSRTIGPILLASFASVVTLFFLQGTEPAFSISPIVSLDGWTYLAVPIVAALASLAGVGFQKSTLGWASRIHNASSLPSWSRPVIGAWINWAVACLTFYWIGRTGVLGLGHQDLTACLAGEIALLSMLVLFVAKWIATSSAYAWGNCGGIFTPTLFIGAMIGGACANGIDLGFGLNSDCQRLLTIVGMSACLGAVVRAPITSILIVFEMTHDFTLVPPLMLAALVSQAISRSLCKKNFYNQFLKDSGIHLETDSSLRAQASWRNRRISAFANFDAPFLQSLDKKEISILLNQYPDTNFPLLDEDHQPIALIERTELDHFLTSEDKPTLHSPTLVNPDKTMQEVEYLLLKASTNTLVLVTKDNRYLGLFSQQESFRSQAKEEVMANS
jgi:CIC family chloride channel protein